MEKRAFLAVLLSLAILIGWQVLFPPPPPPEPVASAAASQPAAPVPGATAPAPDPAPEAPAPPVEPVQAGSLQDLTVETDLAEVTFTNAGGRVLRWRLKDYLTAQGPLDIVHAPDPKREVLPL